MRTLKIKAKKRILFMNHGSVVFFLFEIMIKKHLMEN